MADKSPHAFPFQTAKVMAKISSSASNMKKQDLNNNSVSVGVIFQTAGRVLQQIVSSQDSKIEDDSSFSQYEEKTGDINPEEIPFSEDQIKEFEDHSSLLASFQTASGKVQSLLTKKDFDDRTTAAEFLLNQTPLSSEPSASCEEPMDVVGDIVDINKIMSKYESTNEVKGPKKQVVFNRKKVTKSKMNQKNDFSNASSNISVSSPEPASTGIEDGSDKTQSSKTKNITREEKAKYDGQKQGESTKKIVFNKLQRKSRQSISKPKYAEVDNSSEPDISTNIDSKNRFGSPKSDEDKSHSNSQKGENKRRVVYRKCKRQARKNISMLAADKEDGDFEQADDSDEDEDFDIYNEHTSSKRSLRFSRPAKKKMRSTFNTIFDNSEVIFKVPNTEDYLKTKDKIMQKTTIVKHISSSVNRDAGPKVSQCKNITIKKIEPVGGSKAGTYNSQEQTSGKVPIVRLSKKPNLDPKEELSELDTKPGCDVIYIPLRKKIQSKTHQLAPSAKAEWEDHVEKAGEYSSTSKTFLSEDQEEETFLGPPIKVAKYLPDVLGVHSRAGQMLVLNLNERRPLLFQNKETAQWWDARTYLNFSRMRCQLRNGEYIHPDISHTTEVEFKRNLDETEQHVKTHIRGLDSRTLLEKITLCRSERQLIQISCGIDSWLEERFNMSPLALTEMMRDCNLLLNTPVTIVMFKKTVYLAELYWNMAELSKGMWAQYLSQKATSSLGHFQECLQLSNSFSRSHYQTSLYDLSEVFRETVISLPYYQRIMITHTFPEEKSWISRNVLILTTRPDFYECTHDKYEFTENDQKNLFMLKLLLTFENQISQPIFHPRNRTLKKEYFPTTWNPEQNNFTGEINIPLEIQKEEPYDFYDDWNFKTKPKRINRSVKHVKIDSNNQNNQSDTLKSFDTAENPNQNDYNKLDTFDYDNRNEVTINGDIPLLDDKIEDTLLKYIKEEPIFYEKMILDDYPENKDFNYEKIQAINNGEANSISKISDMLVDTMRILIDDIDEPMETADIVDRKLNKEYSYLMDDTFEYNGDVYMEDTINTAFNSQELNLIYNILETTNIKSTISNEERNVQIEEMHTSSNEIATFVDKHNEMIVHCEHQSLPTDEVVSIARIRYQNDSLPDDIPLYQDEMLKHVFDVTEINLSQKEVDLLSMEPRGQRDEFNEDRKSRDSTRKGESHNNENNNVHTDTRVSSIRNVEPLSNIINNEDRNAKVNIVNNVAILGADVDENNNFKVDTPIKIGDILESQILDIKKCSNQSNNKMEDDTDMEAKGTKEMGDDADVKENITGKLEYDIHEETMTNEMEHRIDTNNIKMEYDIHMNDDKTNETEDSVDIKEKTTDKLVFDDIHGYYHDEMEHRIDTKDNKIEYDIHMNDDKTDETEDSVDIKGKTTDKFVFDDIHDEDLKNKKSNELDNPSDKIVRSVQDPVSNSIVDTMNDFNTVENVDINGYNESFKSPVNLKKKTLKNEFHMNLDRVNTVDMYDRLKTRRVANVSSVQKKQTPAKHVADPVQNEQCPVKKAGHQRDHRNNAGDQIVPEIKNIHENQDQVVPTPTFYKKKILQRMIDELP